VRSDPILTVESVAAALADCRDRSLCYTDLDDAELTRQHSPLMSPLVWDLAHVGNYEEFWLLRTLTASPELRPGIDSIYNPFIHPRVTRSALPLLPPPQARTYIAEVRTRVLDMLTSSGADALGPAEPEAEPEAEAEAEAEADGAGDLRARLLADGFVYGLVVQHEHQHDETMLATHQLRDGPPFIDDGVAPPPGRPVPAREVLVPAGEFVMGTSHDPWAYDNERPAHRVYVPAFWIDTLPVSNAAHIAFIDDGGYDDERLWSAHGWRWRREQGASAPLFWWRDGGGWFRRRFGRVEPVPPDEPVQHVCWYEAQAHARWAGGRLPTEAEWEKACAHDPASGRSRRFPWGDGGPVPEQANLGHTSARPAPLGAYPTGASAYGAEQMIGDVWEWTASDFTGYPGFSAFPYREYSEVFFPKPDAVVAGTGPAPGVADPRPDQYKVLRGGSWATHPAAVRSTFRNWDFPVRRQIFAGFRLARDASGPSGPQRES
jgi:iron(II)-dependent oxidoreductase